MAVLIRKLFSSLMYKYNNFKKEDHYNGFQGGTTTSRDLGESD